MSEQGFTEVSMTYNNHVVNLDRARQGFEEDTRRFNGLVLSHLADVCSREPDGIGKMRWRLPEDWSSAREVAWLNFVASARIRLDLRPPQYKNFKKHAAYLYFEIRFDPDMGRFVLRCRLENQNNVNAEIDETVDQLIRDERAAAFPGHDHIKSSTTILFKRDLGEELLDNINQYVDSALDVVAEAIDRIFPDADYSAEVQVDESLDDSE